jgi:nucleotide-binding universal stress UspA family protein
MIKDVMIYLDGSEADNLRVAAGNGLAELFKARITGLFINVIPDVVVPIEPVDPSLELSVELREKAEEAGDQIEVRLTEKLDRLNKPVELRRFDVFPDQVTEIAAREARTVDTFVALSPSFATARGESDDAEQPDDLVDGVVLGSGRHLFLISRPPLLEGGFERALVAWNGSREAARAAEEAIPYLVKAREVTVLTISDDDMADPPPTLGANLVRYLRHHEVEANLDYATAVDRNVARALVAETRRRAADLVVMGGYGHSRLRERLFGGVTNDVLHHVHACIVIAH